MTPFAQQTPLQRAQAHIDSIKKTSVLAQRRPNLPLDNPDDSAWQPDAETEAAKRRAIENCELAADDYAKAGHNEMAELYRLKAQSIAGSLSATRDYLRKLQEVRGVRHSDKKRSAGRKFEAIIITGGSIVLFLLFVMPLTKYGGILAAILYFVLIVFIWWFIKALLGKI
jgi:hypothetical protein